MADCIIKFIHSYTRKRNMLTPIKKWLCRRHTLRKFEREGMMERKKEKRQKTKEIEKRWKER